MAAVISLCIPVADLEIDCDIEYPPLPRSDHHHNEEERRRKQSLRVSNPVPVSQNADVAATGIFEPWILHCDISVSLS
jgi:hypothetical protein